MDQNRPLTPQEREWQREKQQLPPEADSDTLDGSVQLTPEDLAKLRQSQAQGASASNSPGYDPPEGATIPAIPLNIPRNNPPQPQPPARPQTPNPAELEWHREKQFPGNQPAPGRGQGQVPPEALPTLEALRPVSRQPQPPPVSPEALPTQEALPQVQRSQQQGTVPVRPPAHTPPPPNQNPARPYQPFGQAPNAGPRLTPEEMQWQREKQAYPGMTPQEIQWQREKQAYPTEQTRPIPPNLTPQERQWQQEKQGYGAGAAGLTPQEIQWQREKQAYPPTAANLTPQERQWQQEKQAYHVPGLTPQEQQWQQEKQGYPVAPGVVPNNRNMRPGPVPPVAPPPYGPPVAVTQPPERGRAAWVWFLIPLVLLLIAAAVVLFLLLVKPGSNNETATPTSGVALITGTPSVTGATTTGTPGTPSVTGTPNGTPGVTTGGALNPGQLTATARAGTSPSAGTTSAQNEDLFNQGKTAYDNQKWLDAITAWEKIDPNSATYTKAKPLLANAYYNEGNSLALDETTDDSLTQAIGYYNKASALAPDNADFRTAAENASFYQSGSKAFNAKDWDTAVNLLGQLYTRNPGFRDSTLLYFHALEGQGDAQVQSGNLVAAKDSYSTALGLTFKGTPPDTSALQAKLADVNAKLNPTPTASPSPTAAASPTAAPTPTKKPAPTPTKKPAPTNTPLAPCSKGGSGSNFFPFRTGQPPVPNVPDQGSSGVRGVVLDKNGAPLAGVSVRIATTGHVFTSVTDGSGNYFREGLGRGVWTISVVAAPGRTLCYGAPGSVMLSGQSGFYGSVDFTESVP